MVVHSTLAAEAASMAKAYDEAIYARSILACMVRRHTGPWEDRVQSIPQFTVTD